MVTVLILLIGSVGTARAHEGEEGTEASLFVQQAIALIVNTPDDLDAIGDKINDAIEAPDQHGVDVSLVEQARTALEAEDIRLARSLLEQSIGARSQLDSSDPPGIDEHLEEAGETEGEESPLEPFLDPLDTGRDLGGGDWFVIGFAAALVLAGAVITTRLRQARKDNR
jgi:hypothetical protein